MSRTPTVYAYNEQGSTRKLVAHPTKAGAAKLLGVSTYLLATHGEVTELPSEVEVALSAVGAVWARKPGEDSWTMTAGAENALQLPKMGGNRHGAGKKRLANSPSRPRCVSLDDEAHARFMELGGTKYLRRAIAASIEFTDQEWDQLIALGGGEWIRSQLLISKQ